MPSDVTAVGPQALPVPLGITNGTFEDRTLVALLDYLGFWLKWSLDDKLNQQGGPTTAGPETDACPVAHRFPWNHEGTFVRKDANGALAIPGLWAWESAHENTTEFASLLYDVVRREIRVQYVFPELVVPKGIEARHGLMPTVARIFAKAAERGRHSEYGYGGDLAGTPVQASAEWRAWKYVGGSFVPAAQVPTNGGQSGPDRRAGGAEKHFFPSYIATFHVWERVELQSLANDEPMGPVETTIAVADDQSDEALDLMERLLPGGLEVD